jgi:thiol:disulfide interchange protein
MVTAAGNEEQYGKWMTILKQAAFGLIMIGIAWFIVSIIFFLVSIFTTSATPANTAWWA